MRFGGSKDKDYVSLQLAAWRRWTDLPLTTLAIGSLPILVLDVVSVNLASADRTFLLVINTVVFVAFVTDYVVELLLAKNRRLYLREEWASLLIAVSQGFALLPSLGMLGFSRLFRGIRPAILIWRFFAIGTAEASEIMALLKRRAVATAFALAGFVWISAAVAFTIAEGVGINGRVDSFGDALWWSATTISTVGYGDIYPLTTVGRVVAVLTTIVGVSTFGVVTANLASILIRESNSSPNDADQVKREV